MIHLGVSYSHLHQGAVVMYGNNGLITFKEEDLAVPKPMETPRLPWTWLLCKSILIALYDADALGTIRHQFNKP